MRWAIALGIFVAFIGINLLADGGTISPVEVGIGAVIALGVRGAASGKPGPKADWGSQDGMR